MRTEVLGGVVAAVAIVLWDLAGIRARFGPLDAGVSGFLAAGIGLGGLLGAVWGALRFCAHFVAGRRAADALPGVLDGATVYAAAIWQQNPQMLDGNERALTLVAMLAVGGLVRRHVIGRPLLRRVVAAAGLLVAVVASELLTSANATWILVGLEIVVAVSLVDLVRPVLRRAHPVALAIAIGLVAVALVSADPLMGRSEAARRLVHHRSSHVRAWSRGAAAIADRDGDGAANVLGARDCDPERSGVYPGASERPGDGIDANCVGGDGREPSAGRRSQSEAHGIAAGRDVLVISVDALRWDLAGEMRALRREIGPHAFFTRAVSPAPRTMHSLAATLRGRPFRQVRFDRVGSRGIEFPWRDGSQTIAHPLVRAGYRTVTVPTHRYLDPTRGLPAGFETLHVAGRDGVLSQAGEWPYGRKTVRASAALSLVARAARDTPGPIFVWVHLMETHAPYVSGKGRVGPDSMEGLRSAVRSLDALLARFARSFALARGRDPVVVVFGDHGEAFGEHGAHRHSSSVHAEQVRVGMILAGPGIRAGHHDAPVSTTAIPATVLDLLGVEAPATMTEPSLLPPLRSEAPWPNMAVSEVRHAGRTAVGYTGPRYRYLLDPVNRVESLYDSAHDPYERRDLAGSRPEVLARVRRHARVWDETH